MWRVFRRISGGKIRGCGVNNVCARTTGAPLDSSQPGTSYAVRLAVPVSVQIFWKKGDSQDKETKDQYSHSAATADYQPSTPIKPPRTQLTRCFWGN